MVSEPKLRTVVTDETTRDSIRFQDVAQLYGDVERALKRKYGRGVFVQDYERCDEEVVVTLGTVEPRARSDPSTDDGVLEFLEHESIYELRAQVDTGGYRLKLPSREEVYETFLNQKSGHG